MLDQLGPGVAVRAEMADGVEATLERVAAIGYEEVEFAGYFGHATTEIRDMLARTGLRAPSTHIAPDFEADAWARILEDANEVGHQNVVVASIPSAMRQVARPGVRSFTTLKTTRFHWVCWSTWVIPILT